MKTSYQVAFVAMMAVGIGVTGFRVVNGCTKDCDKDVCLTYRHSTLNTDYVIDTRQDFGQNPVDCFLEFWKNSSDDYYGHGSAGFKNCRYQETGAASGCDDQDDRFYIVGATHCNGLGWDGNWVFSCFDECREET